MDAALKQQLEGGKTLKPAPAAESYVSDGKFFTDKLRAKLYPMGKIFHSESDTNRLAGEIRIFVDDFS